jgi:hypothetical protein
MYRPVDVDTATTDLLALYDGRRYPDARFVRLHPHRLAVLAMIMSLGSVFCDDDRHEAGGGGGRGPVAVAARYGGVTVDASDGGTMPSSEVASFNAASAWLFEGEDNVIYHPTAAACQALHLMVSFMFITGDERHSRSAWPLLGLQMRLCQSLGLHRGKVRGDEGEVRKAAVLWWESYTYDLLCVRKGCG